MGVREETRLVGVRVLVVEDEALLRDMLADALTLARAHVTAAQDGSVAWRAWQAGAFDFVLSDHRMPDCTGYELLQRIRASGSSVPFILVSGQGLEAMEKELARDPRVRLLPKPFEMPRLLALMAEIAGGKRSRASLQKGLRATMPAAPRVWQPRQDARCGSGLRQ